MNLGFLSVYDYLSYILPGGVVLVTAWYAYLGANYHEPGAFAAIALVVAAYIFGQAIAALWYWLEPVLWWHRPFEHVNKTWGLIGPNDHEDPDGVEATFQNRYGANGFTTNFEHGYMEIRQSNQGDHLAILNQQVHLFGHLCVACFIGVVLIASSVMSGTRSLSALGWAVLLVLGTILFGARYKHFWTRFGNQIVWQVQRLTQGTTTPS